MANKFNKGRNDNQRPSKPNNILTLDLVVNGSNEEYNDVLAIMDEVPFSKISVPVNVYRYLTDESVPADDTRVVTIGYVSKYDPETNKITVFVYKQHTERIAAIKNAVVEVLFSKDKNGNVRNITKFNIAAE